MSVRFSNNDTYGVTYGKNPEEPYDRTRVEKSRTRGFSSDIIGSTASANTEYNKRWENVYHGRDTGRNSRVGFNDGFDPRGGYRKRSRSKKSRKQSRKNKNRRQTKKHCK
jgi:hypothetical protein